MIMIKANDKDEMSRLAAKIISTQIIEKPDSVLGLATGSTPIETYQYLTSSFKKGELDFSRIKTVNLDEYKGLSSDMEQSYHYYMQKNLFQEINILPENIFLPNGMADDEIEECKRYDEILKSLGGIDLQLLSIGHNGHIGFNEPSATFYKGTHLVKLDEKTRNANARFFTSVEDVPKSAYTLGLVSIMQAKKIVCIVNGLDKAEIFNKSFYGEISSFIPASILQLHPDVTVIADKEALSGGNKLGSNNQ